MSLSKLMKLKDELDRMLVTMQDYTPVDREKRAMVVRIRGLVIRMLEDDE